MADYDFQSLNSTDFEHLVRDLMNAELRKSKSAQYFSSFPPGRDKGIDLLDSLSIPPIYNWIVQVKHMLATPYATFLSQLVTSTKARKSEIEKIKKLTPNRYTLVTSKSLTLDNREEIMDKMRPYIKSTKDVLDKEEINRLLTVHAEVEEQHPKLWYSSRVVFERILRNDVHSRSNQLADDINRRLKLYVPVHSIDDALKLLYDKKFIVLIGEPGCGKTTMAEMILYKLAGTGFKPYWIDQTVAEIEGLLTEDDAPQVFYFDDFLGHTRHEINHLKTQEKGLIHFLNRLRKFPNKFFILTTRTSLLNEAGIESERFRNSDIFSAKQEINVRGFSTSQKIQIIKNHLDVNEVEENYVNDIRKQQRINNIADHINFSPRLIEFVTQKRNYERVIANEYFQFIMAQLNHPHEVWLHAYSQQLNDNDRFLLTTLFSFGIPTEYSHLREAFEARLAYEISVNHIPRTHNTFEISFKTLIDSFITLKPFQNGQKIDFINPSLEDFLLAHLKANNTEKLRVINSFMFVEQVVMRFRASSNDFLDVKPDHVLYNHLVSAQFKTIKRITSERQLTYINLYIGLIVWMFFKDTNGVLLAEKSFRKVKWDELGDFSFFHLFGFVRVAFTVPEFKLIIESNFEDIINLLLINCPNEDHLQSIRDLFDNYEVSFFDFINNDNNYQFVFETIASFFDLEIQNEIDGLRETATDISFVEDSKRDFESKIERCYKIMQIVDEPDLTVFEEDDWDKICFKNLVNAATDSDNLQD